MPGPTPIVWDKNSIKQETAGNQAFIFDYRFLLFAQLFLFRNIHVLWRAQEFFRISTE